MPDDPPFEPHPEVVTHDYDRAIDLYSALDFRHEHWGGTSRQWQFRGHGDAAWYLRPASLRHPIKHPPNADDTSDTPLLPVYNAVLPINSFQLHSELTTVFSFVLGADAQGLPIPGGFSTMEYLLNKWSDTVQDPLKNVQLFPPRELFEVFALAQHHKVPTRLLDWSHNPYTGAYFAGLGGAERLQKGEASESKLCIWCLRTSVLTMYRAHEDGEPSETLKAVRLPRSNNKNLHAQEGSFTVHQVSARLIDEPSRDSLDQVVPRIMEPWYQEHPNLKQTDLQMLTLPISEAPALLRILNHNGVNAAKLFPGYDGVARLLQEDNELLQTWRHLRDW